MWEMREHIDVPECVQEFCERSREYIADAVEALREGSAEFFQKARSAFVSAGAETAEAYGKAEGGEGGEKDSAYYQAEMDKYLKRYAQKDGMEAVHAEAYRCASQKYREALEKEQTAERTKGLKGKTSVDYIAEMTDAKIDGRLNAYVNAYKEYEHYYYKTHNGRTEAKRGLEFFDVIDEVDRAYFKHITK